jgi:hypothetical protein
MPQMAKRSAGEVLLELLDHVPDAATLEVLLEPEVLLAILRAKGWTDDDVRSDLAARSPGELLLDVLRQDGDVSALLRLAGRTAPVQRAAAVPSPAPPNATRPVAADPAAARPPKAAPGRGDLAGGPLDALQVHTHRERVGGITVLVAAALLGTLVSGMLEEWTPPLALALAIGAPLGALGGGIFGSVRRSTVLGAVCGAAAVTCAVLAVKLWADVRGLPGTRLELMLVITAGVLLPAIAYAVATSNRPRQP